MKFEKKLEALHAAHQRERLKELLIEQFDTPNTDSLLAALRKSPASRMALQRCEGSIEKLVESNPALSLVLSVADSQHWFFFEPFDKEAWLTDPAYAAQRTKVLKALPSPWQHKKRSQAYDKRLQTLPRLQRLWCGVVGRDSWGVGSKQLKHLIVVCKRLGAYQEPICKMRNILITMESYSRSLVLQSNRLTSIKSLTKLLKKRFKALYIPEMLVELKPLVGSWWNISGKVFFIGKFKACTSLTLYKWFSWIIQSLLNSAFTHFWC